MPHSSPNQLPASQPAVTPLVELANGDRSTRNATKLTLEDYLHYDDGADARYELVAGELVIMPPESPHNVSIALFLMMQVLRFFPVTQVSNKVEIVVASSRTTTSKGFFQVRSIATVTSVTNARNTLQEAFKNTGLLIQKRHRSPYCCWSMDDMRSMAIDRQMLWYPTFFRIYA
jgi:hypothetical protein